MVLKSKKTSYIVAFIVVFIWSVTFISTKILLRYISPTEILIYRYVIAYLLFVAVYPKFIKPKSIRDEAIFALAGLLGVTLYFLCENFALSYSTASNVSLLVSTAPMLTGIVAYFTSKNEKVGKKFFCGGFFALAGVFLLVFNGHFVLRLNLAGDFLAIAAALSFAFYSIIIKDIDSSVYTPTVITRKTFFYSLLFLIPLLFTPLFKWDPYVFKHLEVIGNLAFLGIFASAVCFLLWNKVIWSLGAVKANNLIYFSPPMAVACASLILHERITPFAITGGALILIGVYISQKENTMAE